jgi:apolipoprotein N-acyltransferase
MKQTDLVQTGLRIAAWACLAVIALITVGPETIRPETAYPPSIERFVAFAVVGVLFAISYPRYILFAAAIVLGAALLLEIFQLLSPSRHGRLFDAAVKFAGGSFGLCVGSALSRFFLRR